jgi:hypothetical protein
MNCWTVSDSIIIVRETKLDGGLKT